MPKLCETRKGHRRQPERWWGNIPEEKWRGWWWRIFVVVRICVICHNLSSPICIRWFYIWTNSAWCPHIPNLTIYSSFPKYITHFSASLFYSGKNLLLRFFLSTFMVKVSLEGMLEACRPLENGRQRCSLSHNIKIRLPLPFYNGMMTART